MATRRRTLTPAVALALLPAAQVHGYFGGGGGYDMPAPNCPAFSCPKGQKATPKVDYQVWSYGCQDTGMNMFNAGSLDPNNPLGGMGKPKSINKCCVEKDVCKQTCGMTSKACHDMFSKCTKKICKGDQNCEFQAVMADIMGEPVDDTPAVDAAPKYDPEERKCRAYIKGQNESCSCVVKDEFKPTVETKLKAFYTKFNPEKLDKKGEIKDVKDVWKKWSGKEADMFLALTTKYREKAVQMKDKPKPPPYTPPPASDAGKGFESSAGAGFGSDTPAEEEQEPDDVPEPPAPEQAQPADLGVEEFKTKRAELEKNKRVAADAEDYDAADAAKEEIQALVTGEIDRLTQRKKDAIAEEDYLAAKAYKQRAEKLEL